MAAAKPQSDCVLFWTPRVMPSARSLSEAQAVSTPLRTVERDSVGRAASAPNEGARLFALKIVCDPRSVKQGRPHRVARKPRASYTSSSGRPANFAMRPNLNVTSLA